MVGTMTVSGSSDLLGTVLGVQADALQQRIGFAVLRQQIRAEREVLSILGDAVAPPAPGTGLVVDKRA